MRAIFKCDRCRALFVTLESCRAVVDTMNTKIKSDDDSLAERFRPTGCCRPEIEMTPWFRFIRLELTSRPEGE